MYAIEKGSVGICKLLKAKISTAEFNEIKNSLKGLIKCKPELEAFFFGGDYQSEPELQEDSQQVRQVCNRTDLRANSQGTVAEPSAIFFQPIQAEEDHRDSSFHNYYESRTGVDQVSLQLRNDEVTR